MKVKIIRLPDELCFITNLFSILVNENFNTFTKRSLIMRVDDLGPVLVTRLKLLDLFLSGKYESGEFFQKLLALGLTPQNIRKLTKNYLSDQAKRKKLVRLIKALMEKYQSMAPVMSSPDLKWLRRHSKA
jgi:hypothetical protein